MTWFTKPTPVTVCPCSHPAQAVPVAQNTNGWISVNDQIPEYSVRVLVHSKTRGVTTGHRASQNGKGNYWELGIVEYGSMSMYPRQIGVDDVTHWRPMVAAPEISS